MTHLQMMIGRWFRLIRCFYFGCDSVGVVWPFLRVWGLAFCRASLVWVILAFSWTDEVV